jgi:hypothetical protein
MPDKKVATLLLSLNEVLQTSDSAKLDQRSRA